MCLRASSTNTGSSGCRRTLADEPSIPAATSALAFDVAQYADDPDAPIDSAAIVFAQGDWLVVVEFYGEPAAGVAMESALDLASQQAACLASPDPCGAVTRPAALEAAISSGDDEVASIG
jgi:hypothetical protein